MVVLYEYVSEQNGVKHFFGASRQRLDYQNAAAA